MTARFDPRAIRREFPILADPALHYLDNAATAQMPAAVEAALLRFERSLRANVHGGVHRLARDAVAAYDAARGSVARFLNAAAAHEVVFTYGATSAINLLAHAYGERLSPGDEIVLSLAEHHSNLLPWRQLAARRGIELKHLPVTDEGRLDLAALDRVVGPRCRLFALTHCSNVSGAMSDVPRLVAAARAVGAPVMLDGAQALPHGPVDVRALGVDFYAFSGHKCFGPTGIGALWGRAELLADLPPFMTGGQMIRRVGFDDVEYADPPRRFEAGTPPIAAAIGLGAALDWMARIDWDAARYHELRLTTRMLVGLSGLAGARVLGPLDVNERRGVVSFAIDGVDATEICRVLDARHGVALRSGYHCAQPLVTAMGFPGVARASLAPYNDDDDVDALLEGLEAIVRERGRAPVAVG